MDQQVRYGSHHLKEPEYNHRARKDYFKGILDTIKKNSSHSLKMSSSEIPFRNTYDAPNPLEEGGIELFLAGDEHLSISMHRSHLGNQLNFAARKVFQYNGKEYNGTVEIKVDESDYQAFEKLNKKIDRLKRRRKYRGAESSTSTRYKGLPRSNSIAYRRSQAGKSESRRSRFH